MIPADRVSRSRAPALAFWVSVAVVVVFVVADVIASLLFGDSYWGAYVAALYLAFPLGLAWLAAAIAGLTGLVQSLRPTDWRGLWMSLTPFSLVLTLWLLGRFSG
jgi:hypothetical protein